MYYQHVYYIYKLITFYYFFFLTCIYVISCNFRQWQLSGIPCGHVCAVCRAEALTDCNQWALPWFTKTNLKGTYNELVFPLVDEADWVNPGNLQKVLPPVMVKRQSGRPKNKDRIRSKNEEPKENKCGRCGNKGHTRESCMQPLPRIEVSL